LARMTAGSTKAQDLLAKEIADLQGKIRHGQEAQFNYAKSHNLPMSSDASQNVEWQRLLQLGAQLVEAEKDRKLAQGIYEHAKNSSDPLSVPEVLKSTEVTSFRHELANLRQKRDSLLITYTREWPEVKKVDAEINRIEGELKAAVAQEIDGLRVKYQSLETHENEIRAAYAAQRGVTTQQAGDQLEIMEQGQEIETNKQYLNTLLQRQRELEAISGERTNELSIENPGRLPRVPVAPARVRNIVIAFLLSLVAGIGLAFLLDFLDDTVKSIDDVDRYLHLPALALIPAGRNEAPRLKGTTPVTSPAASTALALVEDVRSPVAESYRHLRTSLLLSSAGQPPKTILITSSQPSEGKTTTAINTAVMLAKTGAAVVIVDCDLRRPRLHAHFDLPNSRGLTNWLSGETDLDSLILSYDKQPNLRLLTSGPVPPNPAELLGSEEMRKLLIQLSEKFAHIIIDSPPAISFTDASILATMVDGVVLVVHGGHSSRAVVRRAKQQLLDVGANIFGIVLNNVKVEAYDYYSNYYSAYYASDYYDSEATGADAPQTG
ncbi:MAG TPA: polysaccharide biosynthesis tyrosine autokinase, partial [Pyrinomonadaceae bacterium]|nr:polysaccharide biosynthesis tyrosine autokinase [Pyrinomonadaceae bacterium]